MSFCQKCGKQVADNMNFCDGCGSPLEAAAPVAAPVAEVPAQAPAQQEPVQPKEQAADKLKGGFAAVVAKCKEWFGSAVSFLKKLPKKVLMLGGAAIALVLVLAIVLGIVFGGGSKVPSYALYVKDGELWYNPDDSVKPWQVMEDYYESQVMMTENGKRLFFIEMDDGEAKLFYRDVGSKKDAVELDDGMSSFTMTPNGKYVFYKKDGDLYRHDLKDRIKLVSDVDNLLISEDGKTILFTIKDGDEATLYRKKGTKDKEKILTIDNKTEVCAVTRAMDTIWFIKDETLYKQKIGKDKEKLASDVTNVIRVYESGDILFTKKGEEKKVALSTYVDDDLKASDAAAKKPVEPTEPVYPSYPDYPDTPYSWNYDSYEEYMAAYNAYEQEYNRLQTEYNNAKAQYNTDYDKYEEEYDKYRKERDAYESIEERNEFREELKNENFEYTTSKLVFFDGKKEHVLTEDYTGLGDYALDKAVIVFGARKIDNSKKIKMSELGEWPSTYAVRSFAQEGVSSAYYVGVESKASELSAEDPSSFRITDDGKTLYFFDNYDEKKNTAELFKAAIGKEVKKPEKIDSDVDDGSLSIEDNKPVYTKEKKDEHCDLYWDGKKIDSDVYRYGYYDVIDGFVYRTDYKDGEYTLKTSNGKKAVKIADDVSSYTVLPNGNVTYLMDYNVSKAKGDMYLFKGNKSVKVDEDVSRLISVSGANEYKEYKVISLGW